MPNPLLEKYDVLSKINVGGYGVVVLARRKSDGKEFAMKFFGYTDKEPDYDWILREIGNLRSLQHIKGIAHVEGTFSDTASGLLTGLERCKKKFCRRYPIIVMEKMPGGDLFDVLKVKSDHHEVFSERDAAAIFRSFMQALHEIHEKAQTISCDLKPENLMFADGSNGEFNVKIIDFGMAVTLWDRTEHYDKRLLGTKLYLAPETVECAIATGNHEAVYSKATDIWQAGCILYMLLTSRNPFGDDRDPNLIYNIRRGVFFKLPSYLSLDACELINKIFCLDPARRLTAEQILQHPWVSNYKAQSDRDFGIQFKERIKEWTYRKLFRRFLDKSTLDSIERNAMFQDVLQKTRTNGKAGGVVMDSGSTTDDGNQPGDAPSAKRVRLESAAGADNANDTAASAEKDSTSLDSHSSDSVLRSAATDGAAGGAGAAALLAEESTEGATVEELAPFPKEITTEDIRNLRERYIKYLESVSGIKYETFKDMVTAAGLGYLAKEEFFRIFDWDKNGTVDYQEFLLTLSSFRTDSPDDDIARFYFEVFDIDGDARISREELTSVMVHFLNGDDTMLHDPSFQALFEHIDVDKDGNISFEEYQRFFIAATTDSSAGKQSFLGTAGLRNLDSSPGKELE